jgi:hypothetical protein
MEKSKETGKKKPQKRLVSRVAGSPSDDDEGEKGRYKRR